MIKNSKNSGFSWERVHKLYSPFWRSRIWFVFGQLMSTSSTSWSSPAFFEGLLKCSPEIGQLARSSTHIALEDEHPVSHPCLTRPSNFPFHSQIPIMWVCRNVINHPFLMVYTTQWLGGWFIAENPTTWRISRRWNTGDWQCPSPELSLTSEPWGMFSFFSCRPLKEVHFHRDSSINNNT